MLSELDEKLLDLLQSDSSLSMSDIALQTNSSAATCWRRVRSLEEQGILGKQVRLVDPAALGRSMDAFCQVRLKSQNRQAREEFQQAMSLEPTIVEVYSISGEWDYLLHLLIRDMADLESILMRRVLELENVAGTATTFAMKRVKYTTKVPV